MRITSPLQLVRRSFRWKLLVALIGSVSLLTVVTLLVVRFETASAIERVMLSAEQRAQDAIAELEQYTRTQLSQIATVFTGSVQAAAALEAALEAGDRESLINDVNYELELRRIPHSLVAFTDAYGEPFLAMLDQRALEGDDPAAIRTAADRVLSGEADEVYGYSLVAGSLYSVETILVDLGVPIGTVTIGVPISDEDATRLGGVIGAELCFVVESTCVAGTPRARSSMSAALAGSALRTSAGVQDATVAGVRWRVSAEPLEGGVSRVIAVPLDDVIAPFERIRRALLVGALGALLLAAIIAFALARNLTRPVRMLVAATGRVADGDYSTRVDVQSEDEMGMLADAFNDMTAGLALKERYRGVLDKVVSRDIADELLRGDVVLGGEKRLVTIVFADITNFTGMTDGMEPARVIELLNECMERLSSVIEAEGGVVDKYVGDEIMALFGAPLSAEDDALRGVRAALGMQRAMQELNEDRALRGEAPLQISVGLNTGECMAGNMGSPNRLNYTVLGDAVNMAARVESLAAPGQVLITEHTLRHLAGRIEVRDSGLRELRGFAQPVRVYEALHVIDAPLQAAASIGSALRSLVLPLLLLSAAPAHAQLVGELPTLERVRYTSPSGFFELGLSGRLDLEGYLPNDRPFWMIPDTRAFTAPRMRLFVDAFAGERITASAELRADRGEEPRDGPLELRVDQLFARLAAGELLAAQAGKFVSPFGGWIERHHTRADPFIRPPLPYDQRTVLNAGRAPPNTAALLDWKLTPQNFRPTGAPPVWGAPYQWGAMLMGRAAVIDWRAAAMNSAISSEPEEWQWNRGFSAPSLIAHVGAELHPALRLGASYHHGPWMREDAINIPAGASAADFNQRLWGFEAVWRYGRTRLRGELLHDSWEVPNVAEDAVDVSWYVESETVVYAGVTFAARYGAIDFRDLRSGNGGTAEPWDHDIGRIQFAGGYRIARNAGVSAEYGTNTGVANPARLLALQFWWEF